MEERERTKVSNKDLFEYMTKIVSSQVGIGHEACKAICHYQFAYLRDKIKGGEGENIRLICFGIFGPKKNKKDKLMKENTDYGFKKNRRQQNAGDGVQGSGTNAVQ